MKAQALGLVGAGPLSRSCLTRLPRLAARLGPVAAPSYRLASRLVNTLRAGYPVERYEELGEARTVLVATPDALLAEVVGALAAALEWTGKVVLLCDSRQDCSELAPLARLGAATASLMAVPGLEHRYVVEGARRAVREARQLLHGEHARVFELPQGNKALLLAALSFTGGLLLPVAEAGTRCLRAAGVPPPACHALGEQLVEKTLRAFLHAGRKGWSGVLAEDNRREVARELAALRQADPALAEAYYKLARLALDRFEREAGWLEELVARQRRSSVTVGGSPILP